jgi:hypothetical protein
MLNLKMTCLLGGLVAALAAGVEFLHAQAQPEATPPPVYTNPYAPYQYNGRLGGYMSGAADVINAQSAQMTEQQRARLVKEQVEQKKIETRRKLFDERQYELAHTPTLQEEQEKLRESELRRMSKTPTMVDIWSGAAMNVILQDAITKQGQGVRGPNVPLTSETLSKLNVTSGTGGNVSLLNDSAGKLTWPIPLLAAPYEADRKELDDLFAQVVMQGRSNKIERTLIPRIDEHIESLRMLVKKNIDDLSPTESIESKRYLSQLSDASKALRNPKANNYFNGKWAAKGQTVDELVKHMSQEGLRFGPAAPGDEPAYTSFYTSLAAYDGHLVTELKTAARP